MDDKKENKEKKENFFVFKEVTLIKSMVDDDKIEISSFYSNDSQNNVDLK